MNPGLFGFPPGSNIVVDTQEFDVSGTWYKPKNAVFCIINGCGGGQAGGNGSGTANGRGGVAGLAYQLVISAENLKVAETVVIGAGGSGIQQGLGGDTTVFGTYVFPGGRNTGSRSVCAYAGGDLGIGTIPLQLFGAAGQIGESGIHGNFGPGGGGGSGLSGSGSTGTTGGDGGRPCTFAFEVGTFGAARGGGASGGNAGISSGVASTAGQNANETHDRFGFGSGGGAGGGGGLNATTGGNGRRGGGGGAAGQSWSGGSGLFGIGGNGYVRITTYCWE